MVLTATKTADKDISENAFSEYLELATLQAEPQRLLFVFTQPELPDGSNASEVAAFKAGSGGHLQPVVCVDKSLDEIESFSGLVDESHQTGQSWQIVFTAALSGQHGLMPDSSAVEIALKQMITGIQQGAIEHYLAFDRQGQVIQFF